MKIIKFTLCQYKFTIPEIASIRSFKKVKIISIVARILFVSGSNSAAAAAAGSGVALNFGGK